MRCRRHRSWPVAPRLGQAPAPPPSTTQRHSARLCARSPTPSCHPPISSFLQCVVVGLTGADAHGAIEVVDKDFAVADLAGLGGVTDRGHDLVFDAILDTDLDLELGQEVHGVLGAAINLGMALLAAETFHLGHGHAVDAERGERVANLVELERLDDGDNELHGSPLIGRLVAAPIDNGHPPQWFERALMPTLSAI